MPLLEFQKEPNYKRRHHRVTVPLYLVIEGTRYRAADWSLGGFRIEEYQRADLVGTELSCQLVLPYSDFTVQLGAEFRIVRRVGHTIGCQFIELSDAARRALRHLVEASIEGRLGEVDDLIGVIQAPIPSTELEELLEDEQSGSKQGRKNALRKSLLYTLAGAIALTSLVWVFYRNLMFVEIPTGVLMGNFVSVGSRVDGRLSEMLVEEGQVVRLGEPLFALDNSDLETAVVVARATRDEALARQRLAQRQIDEELARLGIYQKLSDRQRAEVEAQIREAEARLRQATSERRRRERLVDEGVVASEQLEAFLEQERVLKEQLDASREQLKVADINVEASRNGFFFGGQEIEGRLQELRQQAAIAASEVDHADRQIDAALRRLEETKIRSPVDGTVYTIYRRGGEVLRPHDPVLSVRVDEGSWAVGRLPEDEAIHVRPGLDADIVVPAYGLRFRGRVSAVGHQGLSTASQASADMESSLKEVPIKVQLLDQPEDLAPGLRARIIIRRQDLWWQKKASEPPADGAAAEPEP